MTSRSYVTALLGLSLLGCGVEFDPPSELKSLRVMAVQKSVPYAKPGETVDMSMLWFDGSDRAPRDVQVAWISGCFNPPGDLFLGCGQAFAEAGAGGGGLGLPPNVTVDFGDTFSFVMPNDVISSRPPPGGALPRYGLAFIFFAACAGQLGPAPEGQLTFPLACYGPDGSARGSADFVAGYSSVYAYEQFRNKNPVITGFRFAGADVAPSCIGAACLTTPPQSVDCAAGGPCVDACSDDGEDGCPGIDMTPVIDRASAEQDEVSKVAYGREFTEQMWLRYYVERGGVKSDVKLVNDAVKGWNDDYSTEFRAPKQQGVMSIWAVVHDNRGGVEWARIEVGIR
ncbi:MAG: hypothetical protein R3B13_25690 [Polyangiaceae bacterium]